MAAGKDAGRMADAALHSMGRCMGLSPNPGAVRRVGTPGAHTQATQAAPSRQEGPPKEPASDSASSRDLDAAAGVPLPGWPLLPEARAAAGHACAP